jgi:hypothetical protein
MFFLLFSVQWQIWTILLLTFFATRSHSYYFSFFSTFIKFYLKISKSKITVLDWKCFSFSIFLGRSEKDTPDQNQKEKMWYQLQKGK